MKMLPFDGNPSMFRQKRWWTRRQLQTGGTSSARPRRFSVIGCSQDGQKHMNRYILCMFIKVYINMYMSYMSKYIYIHIDNIYIHTYIYIYIHNTYIQIYHKYTWYIKNIHDITIYMIIIFILYNIYPIYIMIYIYVIYIYIYDIYII